ncbi:MAG: tight adherence protein [Actinomycetota bacterium]|nr:tight adherence protein [Actinomycetota bacterium]
MTELSQRAAAIAALADLIRSGHSLRAALCTWADVAPAPMHDDLHRLRNELLLSVDTETAVRRARCFGEDTTALASICSLQARAGLEPVVLLDALARAIEYRAHEQGSVGAATAGTKLQARLVAGLPLLALLLAPAAHVALFDPVGLATIAIGGSLVAVGMRWMSSLVPEPVTDDPVASIADMIAASCDGGSSIPVSTLVALECAPPLVREPAQRARRLVEMGCALGDSLRRCGEPRLALLGDPLDRAHSLGTPISRTLRILAARRRRESRVEFETALRRAPVRMVLPLTLCVLPAFGVLAIIPFLRGLATG